MQFINQVGLYCRGYQGRSALQKRKNLSTLVTAFKYRFQVVGARLFRFAG